MRDLMACEPCNVPGNAPMDSNSGVIMAGLSMQMCVRIPRSSTSDLIQLVLFTSFPPTCFLLWLPLAKSYVTGENMCLLQVVGLVNV